eukprot:TRINITY_DN6280_c0_g1_i1.p1 TRINITY_DN6280_c0_g1~~TRINITY_DN6280_c0_g1_i1.p1  ORF type:complete len:290 (+),score=52.10 TRINITY_DN6280_c0_g1_i1:72-941(+)
MPTLGFIGLGIMGEGMARNLVKKGEDLKLVVWNRTASKSEELQKEYPDKVTVASSVGDVIAKTDIIFSMLSNLEASDACFPELLSGVTKGKMLIDCATLTPEAMQKMGTAVTEKGGEFLEAPVSGTKKPAADGMLIFLTSGSSAASEACKPYFEMMGKATHYYGTELGKGTKMKLVINMVMGTMMAAVSEGVNLAESCGLESSQFFDVLSQGAMTCPMYTVKSANVNSREYPTAFPLKHAHKDMNFALSLGETNGVPLPISDVANKNFAAAMEKHSDSDFSAVSEINRK